MRAILVAGTAVVAGCGSIGLQADSGGSAGGVPITVTPEDDVDFGEVSAYATPNPQTFVVAPLQGSTAVIGDISLSDKTSSAFSLTVGHKMPMHLAEDTTFEFSLTFSGGGDDSAHPDYTQGSFSGSLTVSYETDKNGDGGDITRNLKGTLCQDSGKDGTCD